MKRLIIAMLLGAFAGAGLAATTIDPNNRFAYGANIGWIDWRGDTNNGAVIGEYVCSGYVYSQNVGWINLGSGAPANGVQYQNNSATDFGVNQDGLGNLRGYAYGANVGWINFEEVGGPKVDLRTGRLSGSVWSANCGWISLANAVAFVQTDSIQPGALAPNGLPIAWLQQNFGNSDVDANADPDGDGMSNSQEYLAGTDPNNAASSFSITSESFLPGGVSATLTWNSVPTRYYYLQETLDLSLGAWADSGLGLIAPTGYSTRVTVRDASAPIRFYRVQAVRPLIP